MHKTFKRNYYVVVDIRVKRESFKKMIILNLDICLCLYFIWGLTRETLLQDDKGKKMDALKVFSSAIGYLMIT